MEKYNKKHLRAIQDIVRVETGADVITYCKPSGYKVRRVASIAASLLCLVVLCAFAHARFSSLNGDDLGLAAVYRGDGRFEIVVVNNSERELRLQDRIKVMQWSTGEEVEGEKEKIQVEVASIAPHSRGVVTVDLSAGYDIGAMENALPEGDIYYFVLTNNSFAFGQDWMCFFDFETEQTEEAERRLLTRMEERENEDGGRETSGKPLRCTGSLLYPDWVWPTVSREISGGYGERENGAYSDHINITGACGDEIYAVADGVVTETAFESAGGNVIVADFGGITVKYGHLSEIRVSVGEEIKQGQVIATLGRSGMATGYNLLFAVTVDGENVDPLAAELTEDTP